MKKPVIFTIDDDPHVLRAIERDLRSSYSKEYRIVSAESGSEAVAIFISDQRIYRDRQRPL